MDKKYRKNRHSYELSSKNNILKNSTKSIAVNDSSKILLEKNDRNCQSYIFDYIFWWEKICQGKTNELDDIKKAELIQGLGSFRLRDAAMMTVLMGADETILKLRQDKKSPKTNLRFASFFVGT